MSDFGGLNVPDAPTPAGEPAPSATAAPIAEPRKVRGAKKSGGRPRGSKSRSGSQTPPSDVLADKAAEAAAAALDREQARKPGRPTVTAAKSEAMRAGLSNFYTGMGAMLEVVGTIMVNNPRARAVGYAMRLQADPCASALVAWSESNDAVRRALDSLVLAGGGTLVLAAHAPILTAAFTAQAPAAPVAADQDGAPSATGPDLASALAGLFVTEPQPS